MHLIETLEKKTILKVFLLIIVFFILIGVISLNVFANRLNSPDQAIDEFFKLRNVDHQIHRIQLQDQKQLRYVETGLKADSSALILFIHGAPGTWDAYKDYLADYDLNQMAKLISVDRLGYGDSNRGQAESKISVHADAIYQILAQYPTQKIILVGHSYGGPIAGKIAADHPEDIHGLLMVSPLNDPASEPVKWYAKLCNLTLVRWLLPDFIDVATTEKMTHIEALKDIQLDWQDITAHTIHYHGDQDELAPCRPNELFSAKHIDHNILKIKTDPGAGHMVLWNKPGSIKRNILELLNNDLSH